MSDVDPCAVLSQVAYSIPAECRSNIVVIGSLAAGYRFFGEKKGFYVRTKDIDTVLRPRDRAVNSGRMVAEKLLAAGWRQQEEGQHSKPGTAATPADELPAVRLYPPGSREWFIELLTLPQTGDRIKSWLRLELSTGHFGLPSFPFLQLTAYRPTETSYGLYCARVEMMALANLLGHPTIETRTMSSLIASRAIKRSNKDLGRVLALAQLSGVEAGDTWLEKWTEALQACFAQEWKSLARDVGSGIRQLLASPSDLEEAAHACNNGLLLATPTNASLLTSESERLLADVIEPLERLARE